MSNLTTHDRYIYSTSFDEYEDERVEECFEQFINDEGWRGEALCIINKKHPDYMLECHLNDSHPEDGSLFEDTILDMVREHIQEYR